MFKILLLLFLFRVLGTPECGGENDSKEPTFTCARLNRLLVEKKFSSTVRNLLSEYDLNVLHSLTKKDLVTLLGPKDGFRLHYELGQEQIRQTAAPQFDYDTSLRFVYYCDASSAGDNLTSAWNCPYCVPPSPISQFTLTQTCSNKLAGSFGYVGYLTSKREIVASFRGSSNTQNWIEDLLFFHTKPSVAFPQYPNVKVELGFWDYFKSLKECVSEAVNALHLQYPTYAVSITGHSLGGAAASLFALYLRVIENYPDVKLYTFGEPRVGNTDYYQLAYQYIPLLQRMVNDKDCVPHLPWQFLGYHHEATEIWETPNGGNNFKICSNTGEDPTCSDSIPVFLNSTTIKDCGQYHNNYMGVPCCKNGPTGAVEA